MVEIGGADYLQAINRTADKYRIVAEMQDWVIEETKSGQVPRSFADLCNFARENNLGWFMALCDNTAIIMREFCKSIRADCYDQRR